MGREWYFDEDAKTLYYKPNATTTTTTTTITTTSSSSASCDAGAPTGSFVATNLKVLFNITGEFTAPKLTAPRAVLEFEWAPSVAIELKWAPSVAIDLISSAPCTCSPAPPGTMGKPATHVAIDGITLRDTAYTVSGLQVQ